MKNNNLKITFFFLLWTSISISQNATFDKNKYYRLTNLYMGASRSLDVNPDGVSMMIAPTSKVYGQLWKINNPMVFINYLVNGKDKIKS